MNDVHALRRRKAITSETMGGKKQSFLFVNGFGDYRFASTKHS